MADEPAHRRNQSANAIPLQDLNGGGGLDADGQEPHRRTLSDRGRALFRRDRERVQQAGLYAPIGEGSPSPPQAHSAVQSPIAIVTSPTGEQHRLDDGDGGLSPVEDIGAFQAAIGFAGLSVNATTWTPNDDDHDNDDVDDELEETPPRPSRSSRPSLPSIRTVASDADDFEPVELNDGPAFYSPITGHVDEDDTVPLTDGADVRRSTLALPTAPNGQPHDRQRSRANSNLSVKFPSFHSRSSSRLGDDLRQMEDGARSSGTDLSHGGSFSRNRSLSPSEAESALQRTGTMLRRLSQRVVNVSNESDLLERSIRRRSSARRPSPGASPHPSEHSDVRTDGAASANASLPIADKESPAVKEPEEFKRGPIFERNPLRGKSLGIFPPESKIRKSLLELLVQPWFEGFILFLIVVQLVILTLDSSPSVANDPRRTTWGSSWTDFALFVIFLIYTVEVAIKCVVSGFIFNPREYSTLDRTVSVRRALINKANELFALHRKPSIRSQDGDRSAGLGPPSLLHSFTTQTFDDVAGSSRQAQKKRLARRAFLRHSFNRLDFVAVVSFWVSFLLANTHIEASHHLWIFRMMSCLRILRLLFITSGTAVILRSLKRAAPSLLNVAFLIGFFWLLFSIIGVQSFKSSLRRLCVWNYDNMTDPTQAPYTLDQYGNFQFCGGWLAANYTEMPWLKSDGSWGAEDPKGYICPIGSACVEGMNPYNGTIGFDNILQSIEMVFVIMSSNTFSDIMYYLTQTDYLAAAIYYACGIIILYLWLLNLLIAVITSSFQVIREESQTSAFTAEEHNPDADEKRFAEDRPKRRLRGLKLLYERSQWLWIAVIVYGLLVMTFRTANMGPDTAAFISNSELGVTFVLLVEIIIRFAADWRDFFAHYRNWLDLFLAIVTTIIQIPAIHNSGTPYLWLTLFQILRIYRVVLAVKLTRDLITLVLRHVTGILNLFLFVFLLTFMAAIFASQLFRGELPAWDATGQDWVYVNFSTIFNSFLGMYQIFSSENWTTILYNITRFQEQYGTAWYAAAFIILWFILAFFITLNMFIAVIQENFDVSEDQKRLQQVRMFLQQKESQMGSSNQGTLSLSSIFKFGNAKRQDPLDYGSAAVDMLLKDAVVRDFLDEIDLDGESGGPSAGGNTSRTASGFVHENNGRIDRWREWITKKLFRREPNPFYARLQLSKPYEELDPRTLAQEVLQATEQRKVTQREYLRRHPTYNVSLYIFKPDNPIRQLCQRIVGPGRGNERIQGLAPEPIVWYAFSILIYVAIVAMVLLACVTTPLYQQMWFRSHPGASTRFNWFVYTDMGFAALFTVEAIIKIIADGFFWTPNAYYRSSWGFIDGVVLITLWINVITSLYDPEGYSRAVGAFKALRALRLLNVSDSARDTFHSVIVVGGWKVVSAAFVSLSLLIPFAIYGLNLFAGRLQTCNDWYSGIVNLTDCVNEYEASPWNWNFPAPRVAQNAYYDFDTFGGALFILFQIVSQEGWVDAMNSAISSTGVFTQFIPFSSQWNSIFFVVFNLLGSVFVLTLFISVFMRNYTEQTGVAFLTTEQRSWLELRKLLRQVAPSKRPNTKKKREGWQEWCYRRAITKNGRWQRVVTILLCLHLALLCLEWYPEPTWWSTTRNFIFLLFTIFYVANILIRLIGLSFARFRRSAWDVYSVFAVGGSLITTVMVLVTQAQNSDAVQVHKLFLVAVALLLIPRNNQLDQLFKTAAASLSSIVNLLATWFVLFLVYAIALTQVFGLTRFASQENINLNFRTVPKALILLFRTSMGEGWNAVMEDFARISHPRCTIGAKYFDTDCGSAAWARALFVSWNILSMYIFVNLFISLIYENFSYVYQRSSGLSVISREEIRRFKQAWAEFDPDGTGYISKAAFPRFLGELSGVFEMRIYDGDFSVRALIEDCKLTPHRSSALPMEGADTAKEIDLVKLNRRLNELPVEHIRARRERMKLFYEEVLVSADPDQGISFNALLMILAHYKVINDNKSLKLEEFLRRRARLQRVEEAVNRNIVVGFFDTLYWRRRFKRIVDAKHASRMTAVPSFGVPEILVHAEDEDEDGSQAKRVDVPSVSVTPVDFDLADSAASLADLGQAPSSGFDAASSSRASTAGAFFRNRSASLQNPTYPYEASLSPGGSSLDNSMTLSPSRGHRPSASTSSIQPDWHFAAAIENASPASLSPAAASGLTPPGSPRLSPSLSPLQQQQQHPSQFDGAGSSTSPSVVVTRNRAGSAVSQSEMMGMFSSSPWGASMERSLTMKKRASQAQRRPAPPS